MEKNVGGLAWNDPKIGIEWAGVIGEYRGTAEDIAFYIALLC